RDDHAAAGTDQSRRLGVEPRDEQRIGAPRGPGNTGDLPARFLVDLLVERWIRDRDRCGIDAPQRRRHPALHLRFMDVLTRHTGAPGRSWTPTQPKSSLSPTPDGKSRACERPDRLLLVN